MNLTIKHSDYRSIPKQEFHSMLSLRYDVFKTRLGWELETFGTIEKDDYDNDNAEYLYVKDNNEQVIGCCRLIPTTGRYMLKDTFYDLLGNEKAPSGKKTVEFSRLAVKKNTSLSGATVSEVTLSLFRSVYLHAIENDIEEYLVVTSTAIERFVRRIGMPYQRIGDKKVHMLGDTKSIALSIPVNKQFREAVMN